MNDIEQYPYKTYTDYMLWYIDLIDIHLFCIFFKKHLEIKQEGHDGPESLTRVTKKIGH